MSSAISGGEFGAMSGAMCSADRIIVALDCPKDEALSLAQTLKGAARWLKVGMTLYYAEGPSIVHALKERGFKVFVDLKHFDIPHQVQGAATSVVLAGADMLTVHALGGLSMMQAAAEGARSLAQVSATSEEQPILLAVTVLTSMGQPALEQVGVSAPLLDQVDKLALLAMQASMNGIVASPQEAKRLRTLLGKQAIIVTPGIRPKGAAADDQSRIATPRQAVCDGANYLVIGRPITAADDPLRAFHAIAKELEEA